MAENRLKAVRQKLSNTRNFINAARGDHHGEGEDASDQQSWLLFRHRILSHKHSIVMREQPEAEMEDLPEARNIAITCLQRIAHDVEAFHTRFLGEADKLGRLSQGQFLPLMVPNLFPEAVAGLPQALDRDRHGPRITRALACLTGASPPQDRASPTTPTGGAGGVDDVERVTVHECLLHLFDAIDHSERGYITWDEFLAYLIDASLRGRRGRGGGMESALQCYNFHTFRQHTALEGLQRIRHVPALDKFLVSAKTISLLNPPDLRPTHTIPAPHQGRYVAAEYMDTFDAIVGATTNCRMTLHSLHGGGIHPSIPCGATQTVLRWHPRSNRLFTGDAQGWLHRWEFCLNARELRPMAPLSQTLHTEAITEILPMPDGGLVVASMDSGMALVEPLRCMVVTRYAGHNAGVLALASCEDYNLLFSAG